MSAHKTQNITLSPFVERVVNNFEKRLLVIITKRSVVMRVVSLLIGPTHNVSFKRHVQLSGHVPSWFITSRFITSGWGTDFGHPARTVHMDRTIGRLVIPACPR